MSEENRLPMIALDHCNDCRIAIGSLINAWICCPSAFITASLTPRSQSPGPNTKEVGTDQTKGDDSRTWLPGIPVLAEGAEENADSWLMFYESSKNRSRGFCGRCGTSLFYRNTSSDAPKTWPDMIDVVLATADRSILESEALKPERQIWWDCGIGWVRDLVADGQACEELPKHPIWKMNEVVE